MQKYEYYDDPEGDITYINAHWGAMTFTATSDHPMNRVRLRLHIASGGTCYVKIKATDGSGHPTGAALLSKTINGPFGHAVDMNDIDFASSIDLTNGTKYAIEVNGSGQNTYVTRRWTGASYSGGNMEDSTNSGSSWSGLTQDWCFEIWNVVTEEAPTVTSQDADHSGYGDVIGHGNITDKGNLTVTKRGICYNTTGSPDVNDDTVEEEGDFETGAFSELLTGLAVSTTYYLKAYAYNSEGYGYGDEEQITTPAADKILGSINGRYYGKQAGTSYADMYAGGGGIAIVDPPTTNPPYACGVDHTKTASPTLFRTFSYFRLTGITRAPTQVILWIYIYQVADPPGTFEVQVTEGIQTDPLVAGDWVGQNAITTVLGQLTYASVATGQYNAITLNSTGRDLVVTKLNDVLKFCIRTKLDVDDNFSESVHDGYCNWYLPHEVGKEPYLEFRYKARNQFLLIP